MPIPADVCSSTMGAGTRAVRALRPGSGTGDAAHGRHAANAHAVPDIGWQGDRRRIPAPLLFLAFAIGWRHLGRPAVLGLTGAIGAAIKVQPGLVLAWALLTRRWSAVVVGGVALALMAAVSVLLAGIPAWSDFLAIITRVSDPIVTPHNVTPGAVAYQLGAARDVAWAVQWIATGAVVLAVVFAALRRPAVPSYLVAVVATQLLSPILWDHYAMLLLLPVAWLLDRGHAWAALVPLATCVVLVGVIPPVAYPVAFGVTLVALLAEGSRGGDVTAVGAPPAAAEPGALAASG
jgi:hypothetical protein